MSVILGEKTDVFRVELLEIDSKPVTKMPNIGMAGTAAIVKYVEVVQGEIVPGKTQVNNPAQTPKVVDIIDAEIISTPQGKPAKATTSQHFGMKLGSTFLEQHKAQAQAEQGRQIGVVIGGAAVGLIDAFRNKETTLISKDAQSHTLKGAYQVGTSIGGWAKDRVTDIKEWGTNLFSPSPHPEQDNINQPINWPDILSPIRDIPFQSFEPNFEGDPDFNFDEYKRSRPTRTRPQPNNSQPDPIREHHRNTEYNRPPQWDDVDFEFPEEPSCPSDFEVLFDLENQKENSWYDFSYTVQETSFWELHTFGYPPYKYYYPAMTYAKSHRTQSGRDTTFKSILKAPVVAFGCRTEGRSGLYYVRAKGMKGYNAWWHDYLNNEYSFELDDSADTVVEIPIAYYRRPFIHSGKPGVISNNAYYWNGGFYQVPADINLVVPKSPTENAPPNIERVNKVDVCLFDEEKIKRIVRSLKAKIEIPVVEAEKKQVNGVDKWVPKINRTQVEVIAIDENTAASVALIYRKIAEIQIDLIKMRNEEQPIAAIPEWWPARIGGQRPQLVTLFAEKLPNGKLGRTRWPLTIPHYNPRVRKPNLPSYKKGQWEGILTLKDNSKLIVNAISQSEAERVINAVKTYISPAYLAGAQLKIGIRKGEPLKQCLVVPTSAKFFATGQKNTVPNWTVDF
jgi:hypothetical protein